MKRILLFILIAIFTIPSMAYSQDEHMEFKNVPVTGHLNDFVKKLEEQGFSVQSRKGDIVIMKGNFISKECEIFVLSTPVSNTVWKVAVFLPKETSWHSIKSAYNDLKKQYTAKYGNPSDDYAFFSKPYYEGDGYEMQALRNDKCTYVTYWKLDTGFVSVKMGSSEELVLSYEDKINAELNTEEKSDKVMEDI